MLPQLQRPSAMAIKFLNVIVGTRMKGVGQLHGRSSPISSLIPQGLAEGRSGADMAGSDWNARLQAQTIGSLKPDVLSSRGVRSLARQPISIEI